MRRISQGPRRSGSPSWRCRPALRSGSVSRSTIAPTMALSGAAGASMRRPPGARSETVAWSSMAAICAAFSQRGSRRSRSASRGAKSSVSPSTSMPRLSSQAPSRSGRCSFCTGRSRGPSGPARSLPSSSPVSGSRRSVQRCTGTLSCAKPGSTDTAQPWACRRGTCSAQKSPKAASCGSVQTGPSTGAPARSRHCKAVSGTGSRPRSRTRSMASASATPSRCRRSTGPPVSYSSCTAGGRLLSTEVGAGVSQAAPSGVR